MGKGGASKDKVEKAAAKALSKKSNKSTVIKSRARPQGTSLAKALDKSQSQPGESPWLKVEAVSCLSCNQNTHDIDRDSPPNKPRCLRWIRKHSRKEKKTIITLPSGNELSLIHI